MYPVIRQKHEQKHFKSILLLWVTVHTISLYMTYKYKWFSTRTILCLTPSVDYLIWLDLSICLKYTYHISYACVFDIFCLQLVDMQCIMGCTSLCTCLSRDMDWWPAWAWELTIRKGKRGYARPARGKRCWTPTPRGSAKAWPFGDVAPIARRRVVRHSLTTAESCETSLPCIDSLIQMRSQDKPKWYHKFYTVYLWMRAELKNTLQRALQSSSFTSIRDEILPTSKGLVTVVE